jgi:predicted transcriptional regulator
VAETKVRTVRVDDELWEAAQKKAKRRRETVAAVIKRALLAYVEEEG